MATKPTHPSSRQSRQFARITETEHLLRSPRNARRLLTALRRAEKRKITPTSVAQLRRESLGEEGA